MVWALIGTSDLKRGLRPVVYGGEETVIDASLRVLQGAQSFLGRVNDSNTIYLLF